jgi:hypothetical protein
VIMSRDRVTIDEVRIGNRIYWTLQRTTRDYTLQLTIRHRLVFSVTVFTALPCNVFQQCAFLCSRAHVFRGWRPSHTNLLLFLLPSQDSHVMAAGPRCVASERTAQKTPFLTVLLLLRACLLRPSRDGY